MESLNQPYSPQRAAETLSRLVRRGASGSYLTLLQQLRPADVAQALAKLKPRDRETVFRELYANNLTLAAAAVSELAAQDEAPDILDLLDSEEISVLLQELPADDAAHLLSGLPEDRREDVLTLMKMERSIVAKELLQYPENTAGRIMTPDVFSLREGVTVGEAVTALQRSSDRLEMVFYLYVVDDRNHLVGVVALRQLLLSPPATTLKRLMTTDVIKVRAEDDQEEVARIVAKFNVVAVPVVDNSNRLIGMVTVDDVIDVLREEATEDLFALAGVESDDHALALPLESVRRRAPWLALSLGTALISGYVVSKFQYVFQSALPLAALLPVFAVIGADAATQTLTVVVRSLSLNEATEGAAWRIFQKELLVGAGNGVIFGGILGVVTLIWQGNAPFAVVAGVAMLCTLALAAVSGALAPLLLRRLGMDPASASTVLAVTLTIALGIFCYLGLTLAVLHIPA
jgi:magnesium transporter